MSDRRRFMPPEGSVKPILNPQKYPKLTENDLIDMGSLERADGRFPEQMRSLVLQLNPIERANGSSYVELGHTKLTCAVYGPRSGNRSSKTFQDLGAVFCEVELLPFSSEKRRPYQKDSEEQELSKLLQEALEPAVRRELFPNAGVDVYISVLEDDGSVLAAALIAASLALSAAGIEMYDSVVGCSVAFTHSQALIDPTAQEQKLAPASLTLAFLPNLNEVGQVFLRGQVDDSILRESFNLAMDGCLAIYEEMKRVLLEQ